MKKSLLACLLALCCSCSAVSSAYTYTAVPQPYVREPQVIPVFVDKEFSAEDDRMIADGLAQWNYAMNGQVQFNLVSLTFDEDTETIKRAEENGLMIMPVSSATCSFIPNGEEASALTAAWTRGEHELFVVRDRINGEEKLRGIVLHELGHILGLPDNHDPHSLMAREHQDGNCLCIDQETAEAVAQVRHLSIDSVNYCR